MPLPSSVPVAAATSEDLSGAAQPTKWKWEVVDKDTLSTSTVSELDGACSAAEGSDPPAGEQADNAAVQSDVPGDVSSSASVVAENNGSQSNVDNSCSTVPEDNPSADSSATDVAASNEVPAASHEE